MYILKIKRHWTKKSKLNNKKRPTKKNYKKNKKKELQKRQKEKKKGKKISIQTGPFYCLTKL